MTSKGIQGGWDTLGVVRGRKAPDIKLHAPDGRPFQLYSELKHGKPLVIFNASYTCDVSRGNIPAMKKITEEFKGKADFFVVYTIEPHPADTVSPYSPNGSIWIADNNIRDSVQANQPRTYNERVQLSNQWKDQYKISTSMLVDDPDNHYWSTFGEAPNMAYIIEPDGTVFYKQAWFKEKELEEELGIITAE